MVVWGCAVSVWGAVCAFVGLGFCYDCVGACLRWFDVVVVVLLLVGWLLWVGCDLLLVIVCLVGLVS